MGWAMRMTMLLGLISLPLQVYVVWKAINAVTTLSGWRKKLVALFAILIAVWLLLYPISLGVSYLFGLESSLRALQRPGAALDALLVFPFWMGVAFIAQLTFFFILLDVVFAIVSRVFRERAVDWRKLKARIVVVAMVVAALYVPTRIYNDTWTVRIRETAVAIANLPPELEGFHIVHIADLQADARTNGSKLQNYIDAVNRLQGDVIFFSGDLVTSGADYIGTGAEALGKMQARHGVYACIGDHDLFSNNRAAVVKGLQENGINVLDNLAAVIPVQGKFLSVTGVTNAYADRPTERELATIEEQRPQGAVNIMLIHQPSEPLVRYAAERGYELFLGGHTHGGQIVFPLPGFLLTGSSFETDYVTGFYEVGRMFISINNGLGLTLAPIRYHAPAEVTSIRLQKAQ